MTTAQQAERPAHHKEDGYQNPFPGFKGKGAGDFFKWAIWDRLTGKKIAKPDSYSFKIKENDGLFLRKNRQDFTITWIGHSTVLIQIDSVNILTDPIWSEYSSPVQFAGPKRIVAPGLRMEDLPPIDVVIISHDHYDHLDKNTIKALGNRPNYLVPLGVGDYLEDWGVSKFQELDWGDRVSINNVEFICTPAQHFSGRSPFRRDDTLWSSWVIRGLSRSFYYGGDSGYFPGFKEIGDKYGPFDAAALPIGAYLPRWFMGPVHMDPPEAVQAFQDLNAEYFVAIHWGTFDLADEPLHWPAEHLKKAVAAQNLDPERFWLMQHGETKIFEQETVITGIEQTVSAAENLP